MLSLEFAGRIDQHAFDGRTVVGFPLIRFALRKIALGEKLVECGDGLGLVERGCALGEIDFRRFAHRSVDESDARGTRRRGNSLVGAGPSADAMQRFRRLADGINLDFGSSTRGGEHVFASNGVALDRADEIFAPQLDGAAITVDPIKMRLEITVRSGYVADFYAEKYVAAVIGPMQSAFDCLVVCERARRSDSRGIHQIDNVDFDIFYFFLTLVDGVARKGQFVAVGRSNEIVDAQRRSRDGARTRRTGRVFVGIAVNLRRGRGVAFDRTCQV